jgi:hypothetical protein
MRSFCKKRGFFFKCFDMTVIREVDSLIEQLEAMRVKGVFVKKNFPFLLCDIPRNKLRRQLDKIVGGLKKKRAGMEEDVEENDENYWKGLSSVKEGQILPYDRTTKTLGDFAYALSELCKFANVVNQDAFDVGQKN